MTARMVHLGIVATRPDHNPLDAHRDPCVLPTGMWTDDDSFREWGEPADDRTLHVMWQPNDRHYEGMADRELVEEGRLRLASWLTPKERLADYAAVTDPDDNSRDVVVVDMTGCVTRHTGSAGAVQNFIDCFDDGMLASHVGERLACSEVEALSGLLRYLGHDDAARLWIDEHAQAEDVGDEHWNRGRLLMARGALRKWEPAIEGLGGNVEGVVIHGDGGAEVVITPHDDDESPEKFYVSYCENPGESDHSDDPARVVELDELDATVAKWLDQS